MVSFKVSRLDFEVIRDIAERAAIIAARARLQYSRMDAQMDITAVHANGSPLRLFDLLGADDGDFAHDVLGIRRNLNRTTGQLEHCFVPRYACK